jgi:bacteriocin-like protein
MERVMTTNFDHELTEAELKQVVGGDTALQHETVHATNSPPSGKEYFKIGGTQIAVYNPML